MYCIFTYSETRILGSEKGGLYLQVVSIFKSILHIIRAVCFERVDPSGQGSHNTGLAGYQNRMGDDLLKEYHTC